MCSCLSLSRSYIYPFLIPALSHLISHLNLTGPERLRAKVFVAGGLFTVELIGEIISVKFDHLWNKKNADPKPA